MKLEIKFFMVSLMLSGIILDGLAVKYTVITSSPDLDVYGVMHDTNKVVSTLNVVIARLGEKIFKLKINGCSTLDFSQITWKELSKLELLDLQETMCKQSDIIDIVTNCPCLKKIVIDDRRDFDTLTRRIHRKFPKRKIIVVIATDYSREEQIYESTSNKPNTIETQENDWLLSQSPDRPSYY